LKIFEVSGLCGTFVPHVNNFLGIFVLTISERLKTERENLGLSQQALADACGISARSQRNYESGERSPDADYLAAIAKAGADVRYILTGSREGPAPEVLTSEERVMLDYFRQASPQVRKAALGALLSSAPGGGNTAVVKRSLFSFASAGGKKG
jgi:transcriptional regulator with XRE-family HTH domain